MISALLGAASSLGGLVTSGGEGDSSAPVKVGVDVAAASTAGGGDMIVGGGLSDITLMLLVVGALLAWKIAR